MGKGKAKGKKAEGGEDGAEMTPMEVAKLLQAENMALQRELAHRQEESSKALASKREIQNRIMELKRDFEEEQKSTYVITADMTRQYKAMQQELLNRINMLENNVQEMNEKLESANFQIDDMKKEREALIVEKDNEIAEQKQRMEDMAQDFAEMLKETLDKMGERININADSWDSSSSSIHQRLAEFSN